MPKLPERSTFLRPDWNIGSGFSRFHPYRPRPEDFWKPASKLYLKEAVERYGQRKVPKWDGKESVARRGLDGNEAAARHGLGPPQEPWLHFGDEREQPKVLIFDDSGKVTYVEENEAERWWSSIKDDLIAEWRAECAAAGRWRAAIDGLRTLMAEGRLTAELLTKEGHSYEVPVETWLAKDAASVFAAGFAKFPIPVPYSTGICEGIVLIGKSTLENELANQRKEIAAPPASETIDPHGIQFSDALPKLKGLAKYAEANQDIYRRIEAVAKIGDSFRVLDLTESRVRQAVTRATNTKSLYQGVTASDYLT